MQPGPIRTEPKKACDMESLWKRKFTSFLNQGLWLWSSRSTVDILIDIHSWLMCFLFGKILGVFLHSSHQLKNSAKTLAESINLSHGGERVAAVNIPCWIKKAGWYPSNILPWLKMVLRLAVTASWFPGHLAPFQSSIHPISSSASGQKARTLQHWIYIKFWILINQWQNYLIRYLPSQLGQKKNPWVQAMLSTTKKWAKQNTIHQIQSSIDYSQPTNQPTNASVWFFSSSAHSSRCSLVITSSRTPGRKRIPNIPTHSRRLTSKERGAGALFGSQSNPKSSRIVHFESGCCLPKERIMEDDGGTKVLNIILSCNVQVWMVSEYKNSLSNILFKRSHPPHLKDSLVSLHHPSASWPPFSFARRSLGCNKKTWSLKDTHNLWWFKSVEIFHPKS